MKKVVQAVVYAASVSVVVGAAVFALFASHTTAPTKAPADVYDNQVAVVDSLTWGGLPGRIADPLRCPGNDLNNPDPSKLTPCLAHVFRATFKNGVVTVTQPVDGYSLTAAKASPGKFTLTLGTGADSIFLAVTNTNGGGWKAAYDVADAYDGSATYDIVVTTSTPGQTGKPQTVPFSWSDILPQVLRVRS